MFEREMNEYERNELRNDYDEKGISGIVVRWLGLIEEYCRAGKLFLWTSW